MNLFSVKDLHTATLIRSILIVLFGNAMYALMIKLFLLPANLVTGGTTGLALLVNHLCGMPISLFVLIFNIAMLILGWCILGFKFALTTIVSTFAYPFFLELFTRLLGDYTITDNKLLCTLFAGLGIGAALGLVLREGASTGGLDIPPLILNKYFKIPVSLSLNVLDISILFTQLIYHTPEDILYGILLIMTYTMVIDKIILKGTSRTELLVISKKEDEIRHAILHEIDRGVTVLQATGGYSDRPSNLLLSVISNRELPRVEKKIRQIDPEAFMVVQRVSEVSGRGFTLDKHYRAD